MFLWDGETNKQWRLPGVEPRTPLAWAASALPLSYDSQTTTNLHNPLYVLHRWYWMLQWLTSSRKSGIGTSSGALGFNFWQLPAFHYPSHKFISRQFFINLFHVSPFPRRAVLGWLVTTDISLHDQSHPFFPRLSTSSLLSTQVGPFVFNSQGRGISHCFWPWPYRLHLTGSSTLPQATFVWVLSQVVSWGEGGQGRKATPVVTGLSLQKWIMF